MYVAAAIILIFGAYIVAALYFTKRYRPPPPAYPEPVDPYRADAPGWTVVIGNPPWETDAQTRLDELRRAMEPGNEPEQHQ